VGIVGVGNFVDQMHFLFSGVQRESILFDDVICASVGRYYDVLSLSIVE